VYHKHKINFGNAPIITFPENLLQTVRTRARQLIEKEHEDLERNKAPPWQEDRPPRTTPQKKTKMPTSVKKRRGKMDRKMEAQRTKELHILSLKVGLPSSEEDEASEASDCAAPLPAPGHAKGATTSLQQRMHQGLGKVPPISPKKKPGSHGKREMIQPPQPSSLAPYPPGTQIFSPGALGKGSEEGSAPPAASGGTAEEGNLHTPPRTVGN
jgi:hypothetical protein